MQKMGKILLKDIVTAVSKNLEINYEEVQVDEKINDAGFCKRKQRSIGTL